MKKIALTSLLAMVAATAANANVINGNPLYKPAAGHFASVTSLDTHTNAGQINSVNALDGMMNTKSWNIGENFAYGITDSLTIALDTSVSKLVNDYYNAWAWNNLGLSVDYRIFNLGGWVLDGVAGYSVNGVGAYATRGDTEYKDFLKKEGTNYSWTYGVKGGYMGEMFTVAGHAIFGYNNTESFNWGNKYQSKHYVSLGLDGQILLSDSWNIVMGVDYIAQLDTHAFDVDENEIGELNHNRGVWTGMFGINYNITDSAFVGAYINGGLSHEYDEAEGDFKSAWKVSQGMGMGVKFGIDF